MDGATAHDTGTAQPDGRDASREDAGDASAKVDGGKSDASKSDASKTGAADNFIRRTLNRFIPDHVVDKRAARRRIGHWLLVGLSISIAILSVIVLTRTFMKLSLADLRAAIAATSADQIAMAFGLTAVSFLALTGYDALALRQLKVHVPYPTTALASFTSYAVSFTLGFPLITGGTVRYWIYSGKGLSGGKVASLTVVAGITFWLGMVLVTGIGFAIRAPGVSHLDHLDPMFNRIIGVAIIAALIGYLVWAARGRRHATIQGFKLELPGFWLTAGQMCLGVIDLCAAAGVLFALLSPPRAIDYITFVTVYVFGSLLGIASNAPGGIGVFEATMLKTLPAHSEAELFASLLLFRVIYYLVPFVLALALLGANESVKRWKSLRAAMEGDSDDEGDTVG